MRDAISICLFLFLSLCSIVRVNAGLYCHFCFCYFNFCFRILLCVSKWVGKALESVCLYVCVFDIRVSVTPMSVVIYSFLSAPFFFPLTCGLRSPSFVIPWICNFWSASFVVFHSYFFICSFLSPPFVFFVGFICNFSAASRRLHLSFLSSVLFSIFNFVSFICHFLASFVLPHRLLLQYLMRSCVMCNQEFLIGFPMSLSGLVAVSVPPL